MTHKTILMTALMVGALALPASALAQDAGVSATQSTSAGASVGANANATGDSNPGLFSRMGNKVRGLFGGSAETRAQAQARANNNAAETAARGNTDSRVTTYDSASGSLRSTDSIGGTTSGSVSGGTSGSLSGNGSARPSTMASDTEADVNADIETSTGATVDPGGAAGPLGSESSLGVSGGADLSVGGGGPR